MTKTLSVMLGAVLLFCLSACGAPFSAGFSESGDAGAAGASEETAGAAGVSDTPDTAGASPGGAAGAAGAPSAEAGSGGSSGSIVVTGGTGGAPPLKPPCADAIEISGYYAGTSVTPQGGECFKTREAFNVFRGIGCAPTRPIQVNGGATIHCSSEPSLAWGSVCSVKGDFTATDADGYRYIQFGPDAFSCGGFRWGMEPAGEPCETDAFGYVKGATYAPSDRVTGKCESGGTCEYRCVSNTCSSVTTPKAPQWELVKSCTAPQ